MLMDLISGGKENLPFILEDKFPLEYFGRCLRNFEIHFTTAIYYIFKRDFLRKEHLLNIFKF